MAITKFPMRYFLLFFVLLCDSFHADDAIECPPYWTKYANSCYRFYKDRVSWIQAEDRCSNMTVDKTHAHLVSIENEDEQQFVFNFWQASCTDSPGLWIGLHRFAVSTRWRWTDHTDFQFTYWQPGQPQTHEILGGLSRGDQGKWHDWGEPNRFSFICEATDQCYCRSTA